MQKVIGFVLVLSFLVLSCESKYNPIQQDGNYSFKAPLKYTAPLNVGDTAVFRYDMDINGNDSILQALDTNKHIHMINKEKAKQGDLKSVEIIAAEVFADEDKNYLNDFESFDLFISQKNMGALKVASLNTIDDEAESLKLDLIETNGLIRFFNDEKTIFKLKGISKKNFEEEIALKLGIKFILKRGPRRAY